MDNFIYIASGAVIGDSIGAQYEFKYNKSREYKFDFIYTSRTISRWQGTRTAAKGQWTDDTEMAYANYMALKKNNFNYNKENAVMNYIEWTNSKPFGVGVNTRNLFLGIKTLNGYKNRVKKYMKPTNQSNGSLMRAWPLVFANNLEEAAVTDCMITNDNYINCQCNILYLKILKAFIEKRFNIDILDGYKDEIDKAIDDAKKYASTGINSREFIPGQDGWIVHGLFYAVYAAIVELPAIDIYNNIISKKIDPDTTGSIAGAVIGARFGSELLEDQKINDVMKQILACDTTTGDFPRPDCYHPKTYIKI